MYFIPGIVQASLLAYGLAISKLIDLEHSFVGAKLA